MAILLPGGAGFIGSHTAVELLNKGREIVIIDNFSNSTPKALEAIKKITGKDFKFYEIDYLDREKLENYANELGIEDNVIFTGKVAWEDIPYYYHVSDIFATASTSETQGLTVVEAMAANLPAVCIDDEAFQGTIVDQLNGFIFKDEKEYCDLILKLNKSVKEREKIGNQGRIQAQHLSSSQYAENVLVVYNIAIKNKNKYRYGIFSKAIDKIKEIKNDSSTKQ